MNNDINKQLYHLIQEPFEIVQLDSIDSSFWDNNQLKKAVIKFILHSTDNPYLQIQAVHLFNSLQKLKCPWPELNVLKSHIDELQNNIDLEKLANYIIFQLNKRWPELEPLIMKNTNLASIYAYSVIKGPWPEAEPYIMLDPYWAYIYAKNILERPWPEAEPVIMKNREAAFQYKEFIKALKKQPINENAKQINDLLLNPFRLSSFRSVNPAVWNNKQVKKSLITFILENINSDGTEFWGIENMLDSANIFDELKRHNCPWPELAVIEPHIDQVVKNIAPEELCFYTNNTRHKAWPRAESIIMLDPQSAYTYAERILKRPWPEAEPIIMSDPTYAYAYAEFVLKRPWPQAEPTIMKDPHVASEYQKFVKKFNKKANKQPIKENTSKNKIDLIKNRPYELTKFKYIDPAVWSDNQVKKSVIKYILDNVQTRGLDGLKSAHVLFKLQQLKCPWPELAIITPYVDELLNNYDPILLLDYIVNFVSERWPQAEKQLMKNAEAAYIYAETFLKRPWPEAEPVIKTHPFWSYRYARDILQLPWPEAEASIMKNAHVWDDYTRTFKKK